MAPIRPASVGVLDQSATCWINPHSTAWLLLRSQAGREEKDIDSETYRTYTYSNLSKHPVGHLAFIVSIHPLMLALWL